jgi:3-oxoacyl-(acyl-carrier-protein) synthase
VWTRLNLVPEKNRRFHLKTDDVNDPLLANLLRENPIVVTGMGSFGSTGDSVDALWAAVIAGKSPAAWREFEMEEQRGRFAVCSAPELEELQAELHPVRKLDRCVQIGWLAARQAWAQAEFTDAYPSERTGIMVGSSRGPLGKCGESFGLKDRQKFPPSLSANSTFGCISGALAQRFKLRGPGATISATCASAAFAISLAAEQILLGKADAMIVGGTEAPLNFTVLAQLQSSGVLGFHEDARRTCRPFDATRNGIILGEGSAFMVLESAHTAAARGATALARLTGWAGCLDGSGRVGVHEDGAGLLQVMEQALQVAGLGAGQIDYINAHGTSTKMNDLAEARAIKKLLKERATIVPCTSTKPVTGHCLGATPAIEAVLCIEALRRQQIPPTANCLQPDPLCLINAQPSNAQSAPLKHVMSNSLGFWGYHAALIFSKPQ